MIKTLAQQAEIEKKLLKLDKVILVSALIDASFRDEVTSAVIERLTSNRDKNLSRFKSRLKKIKNQSEFITWKYSHEYAREVEDLIEDIKAGCSNPKEGLKLLKLFFESDGQIIENCDDSSGEVGDIFTDNATKLFEEYARKCEDKEYLSKLLFELILDNGYGVRDALTHNISTFLPDSCIRNLVDKLWKRYYSNKKKESFYSSELLIIGELANALKDPSLLEKVLNVEGNKNKDYDNYKMGRIWLEAGDYNKALEYLEKVDRNVNNYSGDLNESLKLAYSKVGDLKSIKEIAWSEFHNYRSKKHFDAIVKLEGKDRKEKILDDELKKIKKESKLNRNSVEFLLEMKKTKEANEYVLQRRDELNGNAYYDLPSWAKQFEKNKYYLVCVLIYRALLDSILERAYSKAYHYGVDYLKKIEALSPKVMIWGNTPIHDKYFDRLEAQHKRKSSFWAKYNGKR